jgi:hypothetical protein
MRLSGRNRRIPLRELKLRYILSFIACSGVFAQAQSVSEGLDSLLASTLTDIRSNYYLYERFDSGFNHGFLSGLFANPPSLITSSAIQSSCILDVNAVSGCNSDPKALDKTGTWLRLSIPPLTSSQYFGLNIEEPEKYGVLRTGYGLDLSGVTTVSFLAASGSSSCQVSIAVRGSQSLFQTFPPLASPKRLVLALADLNPPVRRLAGTHALFTVVTDNPHCSAGGSIFLTQIQFTPAPSAQGAMLGFPLANQTFGINPKRAMSCDAFKAELAPPDQVNRNLTSIYESSLALMWLLSRHQVETARGIADAFVYALENPPKGDTTDPTRTVLIPPRPDRTDIDDTGEFQPPAILNNGYMSGDLWFADDQTTGSKKGEARLAGFGIDDGGFCLALDGTTGGNNAFAMLALVAASRQWDDNPDGKYLVAARRIAKWISRNLHTDSGFGGFFIGWQDGGDRSPTNFLRGKSVENNADIYAAMKALADREQETGDRYGFASTWNALALDAGRFVLQMWHEESDGSAHLYAGTVPCTQKANPGIIPERICNPDEVEVRNTFDFLDATTFVALAMAGSEDFGDRDWNLPLQWSVARNRTTATSGGNSYDGFDLIQPGVIPAVPSGVDTENPLKSFMKGIAWEFTGQMVVTMSLLDSLNSQPHYAEDIASYRGQIQKVQRNSLLGDGRGIVASTIDETPSPENANVDLRAPYNQCLPTPFQCIASRVGLAASLWGAFAESGFNPLARKWK